MCPRLIPIIDPSAAEPDPPMLRCIGRSVAFLAERRPAGKEGRRMVAGGQARARLRLASSLTSPAWGRPYFLPPTHHEVPGSLQSLADRSRIRRRGQEAGLRHPSQDAAELPFRGASAKAELLAIAALGPIGPSPSPPALFLTLYVILGFGLWGGYRRFWPLVKFLYILLFPFHCAAYLIFRFAVRIFRDGKNPILGAILIWAFIIAFFANIEWIGNCVSYWWQELKPGEFLRLLSWLWVSVALTGLIWFAVRWMTLPREQRPKPAKERKPGKPRSRKELMEDLLKQHQQSLDEIDLIPIPDDEKDVMKKQAADALEKRIQDILGL